MICVIAIFSAALSESTFSFFGLVVAEAGVRWGLLPCAHNRLFGYLSVGQLIASVFAELAARVPRKNVGF